MGPVPKEGNKTVDELIGAAPILSVWLESRPIDVTRKHTISDLNDAMINSSSIFLEIESVQQDFYSGRPL